MNALSEGWAKTPPGSSIRPVGREGREVEHAVAEAHADPRRARRRGAKTPYGRLARPKPAALIARHGATDDDAGGRRAARSGLLGVRRGRAQCPLLSSLACRPCRRRCRGRCCRPCLVALALSPWPWPPWPAALRARPVTVNSVGGLGAGEVRIHDEQEVLRPGDRRRAGEALVGDLLDDLALRAVVAELHDVDDAVRALGRRLLAVRPAHDEQPAAVEQQAVTAGERAAVDLDLLDLAVRHGVAEGDPVQLAGVRLDHDQLVVVLRHDAVQVEHAGRRVDRDLRRDVDRLDRAAAGRHGRGRRPCRSPAWWSRSRRRRRPGQVEVVDEPAARLEDDRRLRRVGEVVDPDLARDPAGHVQQALADLHAGGERRRAGSPPAMNGWSVSLSSVPGEDRARSGARDEEPAALLVERDALGRAVRRGIVKIVAAKRAVAVDPVAAAVVREGDGTASSARRRRPEPRSPAKPAS